MGIHGQGSPQSGQLPGEEAPPSPSAASQLTSATFAADPRTARGALAHDELKLREDLRQAMLIADIYQARTLELEKTSARLEEEAKRNRHEREKEKQKLGDEVRRLRAEAEGQRVAAAASSGRIGGSGELRRSSGGEASGGSGTLGGGPSRGQTNSFATPSKGPRSPLLSTRTPSTATGGRGERSPAPSATPRPSLGASGARASRLSAAGAGTGSAGSVTAPVASSSGDSAAGSSRTSSAQAKARRSFEGKGVAGGTCGKSSTISGSLRSPRGEEAQPPAG